MLSVKIHPITAFLLWSGLMSAAAGVYGRWGDQSPAAEATFVDALMLVNVAVLVILIRWDVRRRRRIHEAATAPSGLCASCGYDLRATPGRCPECGMATADHRPERDRW
jgi:hypothetical protein